MAKYFSTIEEMAREVKQVTLGNILKGRALTNVTWEDIEVSDEIRDTAIEKAVEIIGGRKQGVIESVLRHNGSSLNHYVLDRIIWSKTNGWEYCAGQDYVSELADFRRFAYNL